jgi:hypothetical protein
MLNAIAEATPTIPAKRLFRISLSVFFRTSKQRQPLASVTHAVFVIETTP